jgi:hypothetical protein
LWEFPQATVAEAQPLLAPDRLWVATSGHEYGAGEDNAPLLSALSETELNLLGESRADPDDLGWFPAISYPHLDLAVVRIDRYGDGLCEALKAAGHTFVAADCLADAPSGEGADIVAVGLEQTADAADAAGAAKARAFRPVLSAGHVTLLRDTLSFFWTDIALPAGCSGGPIIEGDRVVGIVTPQIAPVSGEGLPEVIPASLATISKAAYVRTLIEAYAASQK